MSGHRFTRAAVRRLRAALTTRDPAGVLEAGALASAAIQREPGRGVAGWRAAALLEALLLDTADVLPAVVSGRLDLAVEECLHGATAAPVLDRLWHDLATTVRQPADDAGDSLAEAIQDYLAATLGGRATLGDLARRLGYSTAHVSTLVRRVTGRSFRVVRREMQLGRARWLLEHGASVKQAALEAGFSDPAYLTRVFGRTHGMPPSRWRTRAEGSKGTGPAGGDAPATPRTTGAGKRRGRRRAGGS